MRIFATGDPERIEELKKKFDIKTLPEDISMNAAALMAFDVIFDLNADEKFSSVPAYYAQLENKLVILCSVKKSLASMLENTIDPIKCHLSGMNALPTFINRKMLEVSFPHEHGRHAFARFAGEMKMDYMEVEDSVGMVTPRVICMIINEACYSLQEGVATITDIDKAMKLGTNYPFGPFEWCDRIGVRHVYETLKAIATNTHSERYQIARVLQTKYEKNEPFYL